MNIFEKENPRLAKIVDRAFEENDYVRAVFFGMEQHLSELDDLISAHAVGWKMERLSMEARSSMISKDSRENQTA